MTDPTEHLDPPAVLEQPGWKPRHRVDPMRPVNHPITDDAELEHLYQDFYQERVREGRTGHNLTAGLILLTFGLIVAAGIVVLALLVMAGIG